MFVFLSFALTPLYITVMIATRRLCKLSFTWDRPGWCYHMEDTIMKEATRKRGAVAVWFSRHEPTPAQRDEIWELGYNLSDRTIKYGMWLGARNLTDDADVDLLVSELTIEFGPVNKETTVGVFGVFPAPVMEALRNLIAKSEGDIRLYSAWNRARPSVDGGKPTFEHIRFCRVG
jgi:hypothetical protein